MKNLVRLFFLVTLAAWGGCQKAVDHPIERLGLSDAELRQAVASTPAEEGEIERVLQKVSRTLDLVYAERMPEYLPNWIAFHSVLMYGGQAWPDYRAGNNPSENLERIFTIIQNSDTQNDGAFGLRGGLPYPRYSGPYFMQEHHPDQFLFYFSMAGGALDAPLTIDGKEYTFQEVLDRSLLEARTTNELAFTVLAYTRFQEPGKKWQNKFGETVSLAVLLEKLLATPERTCLGTHRLGALASVYARKEFREDKEIARLWPELERQVLEALVRLKRSQRPDGGFEPPEPLTWVQHGDIYYTGHSLEWVTFLGEHHCRDDWVVRGVDYLTGLVETTYRQKFRNLEASQTPEVHFDFGGLCHAMSALRRWRDCIALNEH